MPDVDHSPVLREVEERFRTLAIYAPIGIAQSDANGSVLFVNGKWCELAGVTPREAMGSQWQTLIHPDDLEEFIQVWQSSLKAGKDLPARDFRFLHSDGNIRWGSCAVSLVKMANGSVVGQIASIQDITELKRAMEVLEAERASLQQTIEIQNRERVLTAYEIHDGIVQHVTAALLHIQAALPKITTSDVNGKLQVAVKLLRKSIAEGRHIMHGVQTPTLAGLGLIPTIEQLLAEDDQVEIPVDFIHDGNLGQLAPSVEEALFRITQEALTNARKYSQSKSIRIEIARAGIVCILTFEIGASDLRCRLASKGFMA